jgi:hypothetical protein
MHRSGAGCVEGPAQALVTVYILRCIVNDDSIKQLNLLLKDGQPITFYDVRKVLPDYAAFFKLDGVFGSDIAKDGRIFIDYYNRRIAFN